jgi:hypothetical protein
MAGLLKIHVALEWFHSIVLCDKCHVSMQRGLDVTV